MHASLLLVVVLFSVSTAVVFFSVSSLPITFAWPRTLSDLAQLGREDPPADRQPVGAPCSPVATGSEVHGERYTDKPNLCTNLERLLCPTRVIELVLELLNLLLQRMVLSLQLTLLVLDSTMNHVRQLPDANTSNRARTRSDQRHSCPPTSYEGCAS